MENQEQQAQEPKKPIRSIKEIQAFKAARRMRRIRQRREATALGHKLGHGNRICKMCGLARNDPRFQVSDETEAGQRRQALSRERGE
jgi:hypothetical protein